MQVLNRQIHLRCVKLGPFLCEAFALAEMGEHFPAPDEIHNEEDLFLGLEGELQTDEERMLGYFNPFVPF